MSVGLPQSRYMPIAFLSASAWFRMRDYH